MQSRYFYLLLLPLLLIAPSLRAQNTPNLGQTAPAGSIVLSFSTPPETTTGTDPNYVRSYVPMVPITQSININVSSLAAQVKQAVVYKDGFNNTYQSQSLNVAKVGNQYRHLVGVSNNRPMRDAFSYLPYATSVAGVQTNAFEAQKVHNTALFPGEGYTSYSVTRNTSSATERSVTSYAPGKSRVNIAQMRGTVTKLVTNKQGGIPAPGNEHLKVRTWSIGSGDMPVSTGYYPQNELFGEEVTSPASGSLAPRSIVFKDKEGNMVLKMVADGGSSAQFSYQRTYYVYDDMRRLRYTLPPKAVDAIEANGWEVDGTVLANLCFQYKYDNKGRAISRQFPGEEGPTEIVYDKKDRPVMSRSALGATKNEWEVSYYDKLGRVKATSIYKDNEGSDRESWQSTLDIGASVGNTELAYYLNIATGETAAPPTETAVTGNEMMSYTWYDNYDLADPGGLLAASYINDLQFAEHSTALGAETPYLGKRVHGMVTGSKVRILTAEGADATITGDWRTSVIFYDDKGRVTYTVSKDLYQNTPIHVHYTGMQYDFANRLLVSKHIGINNNSADLVKQHTELTKNEYELVTGNLLSTQHSMDGGVTWKYLARYEYDDMGKVKRKGLGNYGEVRDFSYNIRGQLTGINAKYAETGIKDNVSRTFGELLRYDYGFTHPRYDGKIAGMVWRGSSTPHAYGYSYDLAGRLEGADYRYGLTMGCVGCPPQAPYSWDNATRDYTVSGLSYDRNGNIMSMHQRGTDYGSNSPVDMDDLSYEYEDQSNRLSVVVDGVGDMGMGDFRNGSNASGYTYDRNGNLTTDLDKDITNASYNHFNKPVRVEFEGGTTILYSYDAVGGKVQELAEGAAPVDYVGNFIYKDGRLQFILTSEGRTVYDGDQDVFREEFFVKDHLGNVRSVIDVTESPIRQYLGTYEIASANLEGLLFDHHNEVRDDRPGSYDPEDGKSARLNGAEADRRIGTSLLVQVMAGDRVAMNVNNYYDGYDPLKDNTVSASSMLDAIVGTLAGGGGGIPGEANNPEMVGQLFTPTNYTAINEMLDIATDPTMPKAYLNYVLFDHDMNIVSSMTGAFQANGNGDWAEIGTTAPMEIPVNGYLAVYLSNSSTNLECATCSDIYFDQLSVRVSKGRLLEEEHYYPHGLPMAGMGAAADGFKENRHKHQGNEYIKELGLNWMDFHARQYDPQIGRFLGVDPLADAGGQDRFSPYAAMGNAPESMIDPNGMQYTSYSSPGDGSFHEFDGGNIDRWMAIAFSGNPFAHGGGGGAGGGSVGGSFNWGSGASSTITDPQAIKAYFENLGKSQRTDNSITSGGGETEGGDGNRPGKGPVGPFSDSDPQTGNTESVIQILIWDKEGGLDVGHTAISIGGTVYGYYPTDENGNGAYDKSELFGSKGELHIDSKSDFTAAYVGQTINSFDIKLTASQLDRLEKNLKGIAANPGKYSLLGNNCTSIAINALINSGVDINKYSSYGNAFKSLVVPITSGGGYSPNGLLSQLSLSINQPTFYNQNKYIVR